ncbi:retrovirus-related Pol polyprotein from transposon 17.6 [Trichonephila clavipes]|uniref:Retrovirus-related Pol polyprotein from transposon 17.6 n=1 Tax=Trichonephila clavipes TaxID=2585209 RepID=A0A8X6W2U6_TRICX|nr:retrovirus-related Pol polyprotein from transposon 17.6 [Trichonephila clavipes]
MEIPLRTAYGQNGRCDMQPKPSSLRAQAHQTENADEFLDCIENNMMFYEISTSLACAYLKDHLRRRAKDWYKVLGYALVQEPQVLDYVDDRNPTTRSQLLQAFSKFEKRYSAREIQGPNNTSISISSISRRRWDARRRSPDDRRNGNWRDAEAIERQNDRWDTNRSAYRNRPQRNNVNQGFENRNRNNRNDHGFENRGGRIQFRNRGPTIPDSQVEELPIDERNLEIDLSKTTLEESQRRELKTLFNSFKGLFLDKPELTHILYHEIDTGNNPPVVSRPYRYDRVKQEIIDYHVDKMFKEGTIILIQLPYASPVVLCRKNNRLPPDNPETYRFVVDYRKLNAITRYPRYPLPLIEYLITNIPQTPK